MDGGDRGRRRPGSPRHDVEGWKANPPCSDLETKNLWFLVSKSGVFLLLEQKNPTQYISQNFGEMTERPKVHDWKSCVPGRAPRVQIPLSP